MKKEKDSRCAYTGTKVIGIKAPIIRPNDNLARIVFDSIIAATQAGETFPVRDKDVICITESIVAKSQNNFVTLEEICKDLKKKFPNQKEIGIVFPILSRNRFSKILEAISMTFEKVYILLSFPTDEVGNALISLEEYYESGIKQEAEYSADEFYKIFKTLEHKITGVDYVRLYKDICKGKAEIFFANNPDQILKHTKNVLVCDIHTRISTKRILKKAGANVLTLAEIMNKPINNSGYNPEYGLLGSNMSSEGNLKLFPRKEECLKLCDEIQELFLKRHCVAIEVLVYGDGAYKDPSSGIWELADPIVSPGYTTGLVGSPTELKFKYLADNELANLSQENAQSQLKEMIRAKGLDNKINESLGTTPREYSSLIGSLSDLVSGSGDKGTPIVVIYDYFKNYSNK